MNKRFAALVAVLIYFLAGCSNGPATQPAGTNKNNTVQPGNKDAITDQVFNTNWATLVKDYDTWYKYAYYNVPLSANVIGLDTDSAVIDKATFLNKLVNGKVVAFKTRLVQGRPVYKLYKLEPYNQSIDNVSSQMAATEYAHFKMEGTELPAYSFTDVNGITYSNASTKGRIVVLKCWFIHCTACVKEFPELNALVDENKSRQDILFISLAMDTKQELVNFLAEKEFKYAVVPKMRNYMIDRMKVTAFPTHILIDRHGKIVKVVNRIEELVPFLENLKAGN